MILGSGHSIKIKRDGDSTFKDTYNTWGLIPTERPAVNPPSIKSSFVEIPGSSQSIDCTTMLRGRPSYGQRSGSWRFVIDPDWPGASSGSMRQRRNEGTLGLYIYEQLYNYVHGRLHKIILSDVPTIQYHGRLSVGALSSGKDYSEFTISYSLDPFTSTVNQNG